MKRLEKQRERNNEILHGMVSVMTEDCLKA